MKSLQQSTPSYALKLIKAKLIDAGINPLNTSIYDFSFSQDGLSVESLTMSVYKQLIKAHNSEDKIYDKQNIKQTPDNEPQNNKNTLLNKEKKSFRIHLSSADINHYSSMAQDKARSELEIKFKEEINNQGVDETQPCSGKIRVVNSKNIDTYVLGENKTLLDVVCDLAISIIYNLDKAEVFGASKITTNSNNQEQESIAQSESTPSTQQKITAESNQKLTLEEAKNMVQTKPNEVTDEIINQLVEAGETQIIIDAGLAPEGAFGPTYGPSQTLKK